MSGLEFKGDFETVRTLSRLIGWSSKEDVVELRDWMVRQFDENGTRRTGMMHHFLDSPAPTLGERYLPFMRHLAGDDLTAVLKSHLYLEREMERLIKKHVTIALKKRPMFSGKIDILVKAGVTSMPPRRCFGRSITSAMSLGTNSQQSASPKIISKSLLATYRLTALPSWKLLPKRH